MNEEIILNKFATRFTELIKNSSIEIHDLANMLGIKSKSTIYRYMNAEMAPKITTVKYASEIFNVNPVWLMGYDVPMERNVLKSTTYEENKQAYPLLGTVKAGYNYLANENIIGWVSIDKKLSDPENYFALKVVGDSMQPILYEDDIVIVHRQNDVESGQTAIIIIDNEEATVKQIIKHDDYIELKAFNSYYPPKKLNKNSKFNIIGKVTEARINRVFE